MCLKMIPMPVKYFLGPLGLYLMLLGNTATPNRVFVIVLTPPTLLLSSHPTHP